MFSVRCQHMLLRKVLLPGDQNKTLLISEVKVGTHMVAESQQTRPLQNRRSQCFVRYEGGQRSLLTDDIPVRIKLKMSLAMRATIIPRTLLSKCFQGRNSGPSFRAKRSYKSSLSASPKLILQRRGFPPPRSTVSLDIFSRFINNTPRYNIAAGKRLVTPLYLRAHDFPDRTAIVDQHGSFTYSDLLYSAENLSEKITQICGIFSMDIAGARVCILCPNDMSYVVSQWAVWMAGGVAVPLSPSHPSSELEYFISDSGSSLVIVTEDMADKLQERSKKHSVPLLVLTKEDYLTKNGDLDIDVEEDKADLEHRQQRHNRQQQLLRENHFRREGALIVYTSGTTGRPKGVLHTHGSLAVHMAGMVRAWGWTPNDVILHVLPLHHVHGIINVLMTSLNVGAACVMLPKFDADKVWSHLLSPALDDLGRSINLFMAVPTIYAKLIARYEQRFNRGRGTKRAKDYVKAACSSKIRLMVSGSAALPEPVMSRWEQITGHRLLERYGMTEIGMALTNPLKGPRIPGTVGNPFPGVEVCIAKPNVYKPVGYDVIASGNHRATKETPGMEGEVGELYVRGANLFKEYWGRPDATAEEFTPDGWFKTGDTAVYADGAYRILGRTSVDIIKSGGYKLSALDIERQLLAHPDITDIAIVGLPDVTWGQCVAAVVVLRPNATSLTLEHLKTWATSHMPSYQIPSVLKVLEVMPRNAMGKVNKKELVNTVFSKESKNAI